MRRVFGFEVLTCLRCGGRLRLIPCVEQAPVIARVLAHLGERTEVARDRTGHGRAGTTASRVVTVRVCREVGEAAGHHDAPGARWALRPEGPLD
jgi:hypothetical protein